ncbi:hypothetical protein HAX54_040135 [Datura stramonium]|uniref:Uncharacterized protein n=1 Tax=Datura stramonium TaxID=4076 RepID=A0ABS8VQS6_DATST|nr:hypothetical protein [Datura stramonium]
MTVQYDSYHGGMNCDMRSWFPRPLVDFPSDPPLRFSAFETEDHQYRFKLDKSTEGDKWTLTKFVPMVLTRDLG